MAFVVADRVRETSTTTGTGTFTLAGAVIGYQAFSAAIGNGNTTYYAISNPGINEWEVGIGTVGAGTLARTTVLASSTGTALIDFTAGSKDVFVTYPAKGAVFADNAITLTNKTISGASNTLSNIGNSSLTNNSVTVGSTNIALGGTSTTLAGLTSVTATTFNGALSGNATTATTATNLAGGAASQIPYQSAAGTTAFIANGTSGQVLQSNGAATPSWVSAGTLAVTTISFGTTGLTPAVATNGAVTVAGTLATTNGGTGLTSFSSGGAVYATSTSSLATGTLPLTAGGTGQTTKTNAFNALSPIIATGDLIVGDVTGSVRLPIGTTGYVLTSDGTTASWQVISGGAAANGCIYENNQIITTNYTITSGKNGGSVGPITINTGVAVTVPDGSIWLVQ